MPALTARHLEAHSSFPTRIAASLTLGLLTFTFAQPLRAQATAPQLAAVLAQMDASSKTFQSANANFAWEFYQRVVHDTTRQQGTLYIERSKTGAVSLGTTVYDLDPAGKPLPSPSKIIDFSNGIARLYSPAEKQVDQFKAGANQANFESFLSLGFGGSGTALAKAWQITDNGPETLPEAGHPVKVEKLTLISKDPGVRDTVKQVTIWVDPTRDISLKQIFLLPNGDSRTAVYTDIRRNDKINKKPYDIPKNATVVQH